MSSLQEPDSLSAPLISHALPKVSVVKTCCCSSVRFRVVLLYSVISTVLGAANCSAFPPGQFRGKVVFSGNGGRQSWVIFVNGTKRRLERTLFAKKAVVITDTVQRTVTVLYPDNKQFVVLHYDKPDATSRMVVPGHDPFLMATLFSAGEGFTARKTGTETVAGYSCEKYIYSSADSGDWFADDLSPVLGFPLKITNLMKMPGLDPGWDSFEVTDLHPADAPKELFQIPEGYTLLK